MQVHIETRTENTVEVTIGKTRKAVPCFLHESDNPFLSVYGLAVRYPTGSKVWRGNALYSVKNNRVINVRASGMDRRSRNNRVSLVGFYDDVTDRAKSQHAGN